MFSHVQRGIRILQNGLAVISLFLVPVLAQAPADSNRALTSAPSESNRAVKVDTAAVVAKMVRHNQMRDATLRNYSCKRVYKVENKRFNKSATVSSTMIFIEPDEKLFEVQSYSGMGFLRKGVINRLIQTERDGSSGEMKTKTAVTFANYSFNYLRDEYVDGRLQHVMETKARRKDKLLFNGTIWVDSEDGAITRIEGQPAKNPSFWTRKINFVQVYHKHGPFWFPAHNGSVTQVFIFGKTTSEIDYTDYQVNEPQLAEKADEIRKRGDKLEIQVDKRDKAPAR